jgi:hypothetical protein
MLANREFSSARIAVLMAATVAMLALSTPAFAAAAAAEEDVPSTSIVPADSSPSVTAPAKSPSSAKTPAAPGAGGTFMPPMRKLSPAHPPSKNSVKEPEIEPAQARLKLLQSTPVYSAPAKTSRQIAQVSQDNFVIVTGSTHYFLQIKLKSGQTGYIDPAAVDLVKPTDKVFVLTHDAGVLEKPNRWAKKLADVHQGRNVHIIGLALNYAKIRMKSGLEGFIPLAALE